MPVPVPVLKLRSVSTMQSNVTMLAVLSAYGQVGELTDALRRRGARMMLDEVETMFTEMDQGGDRRLQVRLLVHNTCMCVCVVGTHHHTPRSRLFHRLKLVCHGCVWC